MPTNASDVTLSTDFHACLKAGRVVPQIARCTTCRPLRLDWDQARQMLQNTHRGKQPNALRVSCPETPLDRGLTEARIQAVGVTSPAASTLRMIFPLGSGRRPSNILWAFRASANGRTAPTR